MGGGIGEVEGGGEDAWGGIKGKDGGEEGGEESSEER